MRTRRVLSDVATAALLATVLAAAAINVHALRDDLDSPRTVVVPVPTTSTPTPPFDVASLPVPAPDQVLPLPVTDARMNDVRGIARPRTDALTPAWAGPDASVPPVVALEPTTLGQPAAWLVVEERPDWTRVLVPLGRGALPSQNQTAVNRRAVWVRASAVTVEPVVTKVLVERGAQTVTVSSPSATVHLPAAVGKHGSTPTPAGLGQVVAHADTPHGVAALTSFQSEALDAFDGAPPVIAFHADPEGGAAIRRPGGASNGCVRLLAADVPVLLALPLGTPVWIV